MVRFHTEEVLPHGGWEGKQRKQYKYIATPWYLSSLPLQIASNQAVFPPYSLTFSHKQSLKSVESNWNRAVILIQYVLYPEALVQVYDYYKSK